MIFRQVLCNEVRKSYQAPKDIGVKEATFSNIFCQILFI